MPRAGRDLLIEFLHLIQDRYGYLSAAHLMALAEEMRMAQAEVYEVATFYAHFDVVKEGETPPPPLTIRVCESLSCDARRRREADRRSAGDGRARRAGRARAVRGPLPHRAGRRGRASLRRSCRRGDGVARRSPSTATIRRFPTTRTSTPIAPTAATRPCSACAAACSSREQLVDIVDKAGLRGCGGAGFPTARKWRSVLGEPGPRLMAVNADEGEPGTFKDRHFLETDPHRVLEGMLMGAHLVEAADIYFYLRDEYPECREILLREIGRLDEAGLLAGARVHLRRGAGAYICGEESAMIESIEGKRGLPRHKPPLPFQVGIFGRPTLINNVETLYWIRDLVERGPEWWTGQGRNGRKGLHVYSVSGRVADPGVKIAPAGVTVRELIDEFCGGMLPGQRFKAYVPGGPSSGILPASMGDIPLDFGTLEPHGSFIGSAAVIILSDKDDIKDAALNLMRFFRDESCGQCTPCRVGTEKAVKLMARARLGREAPERAVGRHARRLDLRPRPGGAQLRDARS